MLASTQNQSWNPPMMGQDYINDLLIGGYDYSLYPGQNGTSTDVQKTTYGSACLNGSILMAMEDGAQGAEEMAKWHIFGDASLQVRTETPQTATLSNNVILMGVDFSTTVTLGSNPAVGALVSLYQNGVVFSGITDDAGSVTIAHGLTAGDAQLIVTGFNIDTIFEDVAVVPPGGAYVMFEDCLIEDQSSNNNGLLDYGETIDLGVTLVNVGTDDATGVIATLSSSDVYVTILDDTENYGDISGGASAMISGAFQISVDDLIPDGHGIIFSVEINDGSETWTSNFSITAHAPILEMGTFVIDDTASGNSDFFWDAGETVDIYIAVENNGSSDVFGVDGELICNDPNITLNSNQATYGTLAFGENSEQSFNATSSPNTPQAHLASFTLDITTDIVGLTGSGAFDAQIGGYLIEEYFDNAFPPTNWSISGANPGNWSASTTSNAGGSLPEVEFSWSPSFTGFSALTSPIINTTGSSSLSLTYNHFLNDFSNGGYSIGVKTTSDGGTNWNTAYEVFPTGDVGPETLEITIETPDVGSSDFQIAFFFDGYSYDIDYYFLDNIILGGGASNPGYAEGTITLNQGSGNVEEVEVSADGIVTNPDASGAYSLELMPGTYSVTASLDGYATVTINDVIVESELVTDNIDFTLEVAAMPENLVAEVIDFNDVNLSWDTPTTSISDIADKKKQPNSRISSSVIDNSRSILEGFNVYKDDELLTEITDPGATSYDDIALDAGDYEYCITAVYDVGESSPCDVVVANVYLEVPTNITAIASGSNIVVSWIEPMENRELASYNIYRNSELIAESVTETSYQDENVPTGSYTYNITALYDGGWESEFSDPATINHTDSPDNLIPIATELTGNYPNPFNPVTNISFAIESADNVSIEIFNIRGEKVKTLVNDHLEPGYYSRTWNGNTDNQKPASSGIYFYKMRAGGRYTSTRKMILLK